MALIKGKDVWPLLKQTGSDWSEDKAPKLAAALATYTMLSIAPLLVIVTKIVGIAYNKGAGQKIYDTLQNVMPGVGGDAIKQMIEQNPTFGYRTVARLLGFNKNTVQRVFQHLGWKARRRMIVSDGR